MFYLKEIYFRFQYILFSLFICLIICYYYKTFFLFLITLGLQPSSNSNYNSFGIEHLIYTHPVEIFSVQILMVLYFSFLIIFPYFCWCLLDFLKPGLMFYEYRSIKIFIFNVLLVIFFLNILCFLDLFPKFWFFFENFNKVISSNQPFDYFLELKINDYFYFVLDFIYLVNIFLIVFVLFLFFTYFYGLKRLLYWKKLFIFLNIVFATLLSPPDVYTQLMLFFILSIILEVTIIFLIYYFKLNKYVLVW